MADELEMAKNSLDLVSGLVQAGSTFSDVSNIISLSGALGAAFPVVGALLTLIGGFNKLTAGPAVNDAEIQRGFRELGNKINRLRYDVQDLRSETILKIVGSTYTQSEQNIETGMEYLFKISNATVRAQKTKHKQELKNHCNDGKCTVALDYLFSGITKNRLFQSNILETFYNVTGGHRPKISAFAIRLLQLVSSGMLVVSAYETILYELEKAEEITRTSYVSQWENACDKVQSVLEECEENFGVNMLNDLNKELDEGGRNEDIVAEISNFMSDKYDWLENYCLVYDDVYGSDKHWFNGHRVASLHRNGKCGIVFYRWKDETPSVSIGYDKVYELVDKIKCGFSGYFSNVADAEVCYNKIMPKITEADIQWAGFVVISGSSPSLNFEGTFSTSVVHVNKRVSKVGLGAARWYTTARTILLMN